MSSTTPTPSPGSPRYGINRVIVDLTRNPDGRTIVASNKAGFLAGYRLNDKELKALMAPDWRGLLELGVLPNLVYRYYMMHGLPPETFPSAVKAGQ